MKNKYIEIMSGLIVICFSFSLQAQAAKRPAKTPEPSATEVVKPVVSEEENKSDIPKNKVDDDYRWTMYLRATNYSVDSATASNALKVNNVFILNRIAGGRTSFTLPSSAEFKGTGVDYGFGVRHGKLFKSNWLFSYAKLQNSSITSIDFDSASSSSFLSGSTIVINASGPSQYTFDRNTLKTGRISYTGEFFPWHSTSPMLAKLGIRIGTELYANGLKMNSPYNIFSVDGTATITSSSSSTTIPVSSRSIDFISQDKITYTEGFANAVIGLGYAFDIKNLRIDMSADYFKSYTSAGTYKSTYNSFSSFFPTKATSTGTFATDLSGYRIITGFKYQFFENFGMRISAGYSEATHSVANSKFKDVSGLSSSAFFSLLRGNVLPYIVSTQPGFGPNPSSTDKRTQVGVEFFFRF